VANTSFGWRELWRSWSRERIRATSVRGARRIVWREDLAEAEVRRFSELNADKLCRVSQLRCGSSLRGGSSWLDGESKLFENLDGAGLPALEITGGKALAGGELIGCAQDCFRWVKAFFPHQIVSRGRSESMRREEPLRP
jgi:hypothetical protein